MKNKLVEAIKLWWSITGTPTEAQAKKLYDAEDAELAKEKLGTDAWQLEASDVDWCNTQWRMLAGTVDQSYEILANDKAIEAVIASNLSKITKVVELGINEAKAYARKLEGKRYPRVEAVPKNGYWVWVATAGKEASKVLKGVGYRSKEDYYR